MLLRINECACSSSYYCDVLLFFFLIKLCILFFRCFMTWVIWSPEVSRRISRQCHVMRVTAVIDMHFYPCIQDIIETTGLSKSNYNSSKPHYWTIMANWPHRDQLLECCRGCLRSLKCTYELIKTRHGGRGENALERFKTGFYPPDVSLSEYIMQYLIFLSKVVSMKSKDKHCKKKRKKRSNLHIFIILTFSLYFLINCIYKYY